MTIHRRSFLRNISMISLGTGITAAIPIDILAAIRKKISPAEKINVGVIGCRGQGWSNLTSMLRLPEIQCTALCDVDETVLNNRKKDLEKINNHPTLYKDYRKLLESKDVDVVIIATPDHWHCLQMVDSCAAGKAIYMEKPVSNSIIEAQIMLAAAHKHNSFVQVNQWQRSQQHFKKAIEIVHSGQLGKIHSTRAWMYRGGTTALPVLPNEEVPAGVDYAMWLGPAENRPFNKNRFHYEFRWFWDYAGGLMTDWGVHLIDMVLLGMKAGDPKSVVSSGGKFIFPGDARLTPDLQTAVYDYGDFQMTWEHHMGMGSGPWGLQHGISFSGENGTLLLNRGGWEIRPDKQQGKDKMEAVAWQKATDNGMDVHTTNFVESLKANKKELLNCPIEAGVKVAIHAHMGNVAHRSNEKILWNEAENKFNIKAANKLLAPEYHNGWKLPKI